MLGILKNKLKQCLSGNAYKPFQSQLTVLTIQKSRHRYLLGKKNR